MSAISTISLGNFFFHYSITENPDTSVFSLHCHDVFEVYFFISGEGYYLIEGCRYELQPFSMVVIRPGEVHCFKSTGDSPYERYVINFSDDSIDAGQEEKRMMLSPFFDRELGSNNLYLIINEKSIIHILDEFTYASSLPENEKKLSTRYLLGLLLIKILVISKQEGYRKSENFSSGLVTGVLKCINENLTEHLSLDDIAARFYISKYYLSRIFKSLTGVSVIEYLIRKRVYLSQQLLKDGATAAEACLKSGFGDYSSFYRAFKRIVGCSPLDKKENGGKDATTYR